MTQVCVNGAQVQLQPMGPQQLIPPTSSIPAMAQNKLTVGGKAALVPADIQAWAASYTAAYINPPYVGGQVQGSTAQISAQATKTTGMGQPAIVQSTQIILTVNVTTKATEPVGGTQDPVPQFPVQVIFTSPGQIKLTSV